MKKCFYSFTFSLFLFFSCNSNKKFSSVPENRKILSDTIHISNPDLEYDVIIIDPGFATWFNSFAKQRNYYSQSYLETRNKVWVLEWNRRAMQPLQYNSNLYEMSINYEPNTNYGYEVNYMIYNYLVYFQLTNKQQLGGFVARI